MNNYTLEDRINFYNGKFPSYPKLFYDKGWIIGVWMIGANYKGSGYYGSFPPSYRDRVTSMFPDAGRVLHLFSGSLKQEDVEKDGEKVWRLDIREDLNSNTDIIGNAEMLSEEVNNMKFDLIVADPPYSSKDAEKYGTPMVNRNKVVKECAKVLDSGGYLCWLDTNFPMYRKKELDLVGTIGLIRSTNHRVRTTFIWRRL